ncbi:MAG: hypothetical protein KBT47_02930, partial [Armatimonadetes bacterium]|nr:hypothetical protein [Candidatus Hippobium faecium]
MKIFLAVVLLFLGMCLYAEENKDYDIDLEYSGTDSQVYSMVPVFGNENVKTEWSASFDNGGIHFSVICYDPDIINASASVIKRDGPVWNDDCVEIFIKPNWAEKEKGDYYHYIVSYNNVQTDEVVQDSSVDTYFESNVKYEKDRWTADIY